DPVPAPPLPWTEIVTTDGRTWSATEVTAQALTCADGTAGAGAADDCVVAPTMTPPITPPTTKAAPAAVHGSHLRGLECFASFPVTLLSAIVGLSSLDECRSSSVTRLGCCQILSEGREDFVTHPGVIAGAC